MATPLVSTSREASPQCIYCKERTGPFCREHVIPQAFGSFGSQTMVLTKEVCCQCNRKLGAELDEILARDSYEALIRVKHLPAKKPSRVAYRSRQVEIRLPDEDQYGIYRGARMSMDWGTRKPKPLTQVLVRDEKGIIHSFTAEEMPPADEQLFRNRPRGSVWIVGDAKIVPELMRLAEAKGARFTSPPQDAEPPPAAAEGRIVVEISGLIDICQWRAIAKIAFNYLAKIQGAAYVLDNRFDKIREYIRGTQCGRQLVQLLKQPILRLDGLQWRGFGGREFSGHLVLFQTIYPGLRAHVSLFNTFSYEVLLCPELLVFTRLSSGHAFDPEKKRMSRLVGLPRSIWVPGKR